MQAESDTQTVEEPTPAIRRRAVVYATSALHGPVDDFVPQALSALTSVSHRVIVVACGRPDDAGVALLRGRADELIVVDGDFSTDAYRAGLHSLGSDASSFDEIVLTGDSWFGPLAPLTEVLDRMDAEPADFWEMVAPGHTPLPAFPDQGFPARDEPWLWLAVRPAVFLSPEWADLWGSPASSSRSARTESRVGRHLRSAGFHGAVAYPNEEFGHDDAAVFCADLLVRAGCPLVRWTPFTLYPPYLHQQAIVGADIVEAVSATGFDLAPMWQHLARIAQPKALNTAAAMLEVPLADPEPGHPPEPSKIAVVAHVGELDGAADTFERLRSLPPGFELIVTTSDGRAATALTALLEEMSDIGFGALDVRVTPGRHGRDMSDFFVACRDVLRPGRFDIVVKIHHRAMRRKTMNVRRYFRRYQLENLLESRAHVDGILRLFDREPGLGLVFPPMMHIGYATMGRAWSAYREPAERLLHELDVAVPLDRVSPLAPFGGMWFSRPEALALLADRRWQYRDYGKPGRTRFRDLARLQERVVVAAAAERGYHSRTVLTPDHAAISHTALEFKVDQLFSTTYGYPLDSILLLQRAGNTGYGGIIGLSRMYLRLNHRRLARVLLPLLNGAQWVYSSVRGLMGDERFQRPREVWKDEEL